jgi:ElaB/YqjD/DUF883 family membrane-anchored ribosome-binding protein
MGEDPSTIRHEIEETRERMGDTVDALAYKADVKTRAKESVSEKVDSLKSKVTGAKDSVTGTVSGAKDSVAGAAPSPGQVKHGARRAAGVAQENPIGLAVGAAAVGFVAGMLVPSTRVEDERLGPVADQVKEQAAQTGREALEHGKQVAQDVAEQAKETAKESGREHADEVRSSAQDAAQQTREQVSSNP